MRMNMYTTHVHVHCIYIYMYLICTVLVVTQLHTCISMGYIGRVKKYYTKKPIAYQQAQTWQTGMQKYHAISHDMHDSFDTVHEHTIHVHILGMPTSLRCFSHIQVH